MVDTHDPYDDVAELLAPSLSRRLKIAAIRTTLGLGITGYLWLGRGWSKWWFFGYLALALVSLTFTLLAYLKVAKKLGEVVAVAESVEEDDD